MGQRITITQSNQVKVDSFLFKRMLHPFPRGIIATYSEKKWTVFKIFNLQNHWSDFNQTWHRADLVGFFSNAVPHIFPSGNSENIFITTPYKYILLS